MVLVGSFLRSFVRPHLHPPACYRLLPSARDMATDWSGAPRARGGSQAVLRWLVDSAANACRCLPHRSECCHTSLSLRGLRSTLRCTQVCVTIELLLVRRLRRAVKFAHRQSVGGKRKGDASESMQESLLSDAGTDGSSKAKAAEGAAAKGSRKASIAKLLWLQVPDIPYVRALLCFATIACRFSE